MPIILVQVKKIVADDFQVSAADDKYRIRVNFNTSDFSHPDIEDDFPLLNGQALTTVDQDNDNRVGE